MRRSQCGWALVAVVGACADDGTPVNGPSDSDAASPACDGGISADDASGSALDAGRTLTDAEPAARDADASSAAGTSDASAAAQIALGVRWTGRVVIEDTSVRFAWSGSGFVARFRGTKLTAQLRSEAEDVLLLPVLDGSPMSVIRTGTTDAMYTLVEGLTAGEHVLELARQTEGREGATTLSALGSDGELLPPPAARARKLEVLGDSISAGFGALGSLSDSDCYASESHWDSYDAQLARMLDAELTTIAASGMGVTRNYGGDSAFTMREMYPRTLPNEPATWTEPAPPDAVLINLGTNDISNNKGDPGSAFEQRYVELLRELRRRYPEALLVGTIGPMLAGGERATMQGHISAALATFGDSNALYYGDIEPQGPDKFACSYHPNPAEHTLVAEQLARLLAQELGW